ncbi:MAG: GNAT family N-acetyltransferase [Anaerolineae bacterium]|nr:GNAT family N-acetyltransferase [Anaerolineae bacterium]NIN98815.1 GNAT family N-acetyltransferase [Anaerolineae bacterium]NIQ81734.1 GNAT family N-acetyltransferase [Anaerolineae bacterium]
MANGDEYQYQKMVRDHLQQVVALHEECFPGYYLTQLGPSFLEAMYAWYLESPEAIAHVAVGEDRRLLGFVAGTMDGPKYQVSLFRKTWRPMLLALFRSLVSKPALTLRLVAERKDLAWQGLSSIFGLGFGEKSDAKAGLDQGPPSASLVSIGVKPSARRSGVGTELSELFLTEARERGCEQVTLSVRDDNLEARRFYESMNWKETARSSETYHGHVSITYEKDLTNE